MITRKYNVEGKAVDVQIDVVVSDRPQMIFVVTADKDLIQQYIDGNTLQIAFDVDDILDAIREALSKKKVLRD